MGKVLVSIGWFDLIDCPNRISEDIEKYANKFLKTQKYKTNRFHTVDKNGNFGKKKLSIGISYDTRDFVNWLNSSQLSEGEEKVVILREDIEPTEEEHNLPCIYF